MDTTFIYNGKSYTTPNLEKKLKRMKITKDEIEIIDSFKTINEDDIPEWKLNGLKKYRWICINGKEKGYSVYGVTKSSTPPKPNNLNGEYILEWL